MSIEKQYGDYKIEYDENREEWFCRALDMRSAKLSDLQKRIDRHGQSEKKFERFDAYVKRYGMWKVATVTSVTEDREAWVTYKDDKRREKTDFYNIYPMTEANTQKYNEIDELEKQVDALNAQISALYDDMECWQSGKG